MAWRNLAQVTTSNIPQNMIANPDAFVSAFASATTGQQRDQVCAQYVFPTWNGIRASLLNVGKIAGDNTNYIELIMPSTAWRARSYYNSSQINFTQESWISTDYTVCYVALVNDETQKGWFSTFVRYQNTQGCTPAAGSIPPGDSTIQSRMYTILTGNPLVVYNWKSVKSLSLGNMENYVDWKPYWTSDTTMLLSYIPDEALANLDINTPERDKTEFILKSPSIEGVMVDFNDTTVTERILKLSNGNYCLIGIQTGILIGHTFTIKFYKGDEHIPLLLASLTFTSSDGTPYLAFIIDNENEKARLNVIFSSISYDSSTGENTPVVDYNTITHSDNDMNGLYIWLNGSSGDEEDIEDDEENPIQGDNETDPVIHTPLNRPDLPTLGACDSGFVKLFNVSKQNLEDLCAFMWDDSLITNLGRLFSDPRQIIVGISVYPISPKPSDVTSGVTIKAGNLSTGIQADLLKTEYRTRFAGKRRVPKGDSNFMSFPPYRRIKLVLPYCGEHELDPSSVYGRELKLYYHISFFSGACIVEVDRDDEPFLFFSGQMGFQVPMSGEDYTRTLSALISAGASIGATMATGGAAMAIPQKHEEASQLAKVKRDTGVGSSIANAVSNGFSPGVSYNSGGGATTGFISSQQPYLVFEESIPAYDGSQREFVGNTYYKVVTLDNIDGFTKCFNAHIEGLNATSEELDEIDKWLHEGVIIKHDGSPTPSDTPTDPSAIIIDFMHCESERNVVGKKWDTPVPIEGKLIYEQSISTPKILIEGNMIGYNYCYIHIFNRFYWIKDIRAMKNNITEVSMIVDPLQSFDQEIKGCRAAVDRQYGKGNAFIEDPYRWVQANRKVKTLDFKDGGITFDFDHQEDCYILAIAGGT